MFSSQGPRDDISAKWWSPITSKRQQHKLHLRVASWGDCSHHTLQHKPNLQLLLRSCAYRASKSESLSEPTLHYGLLSDKSWSFLPESPGCGMTVPDKSVSHFHWTFLLDHLCYLHLPSTCASKMAATSGDQQWLPWMRHDETLQVSSGNPAIGGSM